MGEAEKRFITEFFMQRDVRLNDEPIEDIEFIDLGDVTMVRLITSDISTSASMYLPYTWIAPQC